MRDINSIVTKLGQRVKEIDSLIQEIHFISKNSLGDEVVLDMDHLTLMGHGFGATTAITMASKDDRIKKVVSYDAWLTPLKDEISDNQIRINKPHCSINSELF